ncbi:MAG TPA: signal peptidase I [Pirellulales bacterium]|nr:signal peptidase I [Pirellulales bacterium]
MAKKTPPQLRGKLDPKNDSANKTDAAKTSPRDSLREMIESVVIAFVLAFLFRTFEAEAFVIPTGSMAPTLMGRHKDLICPNCEFPYRVSASDEEPRNGEAWQNSAEEEANKVVASICPVCRYQMNFGPSGADSDERHASFKGDRILVAKFPYEFADPKRWDVAVFKNPSKAKENYIKRVVGLPNETVVICHGDVHTTQEDIDGPLSAAAVLELQQEGTLHIERKPPAKVEAMLQVVHDNDYLSANMPLRWEPQTPGWQTLEEGGQFAYDGKAGGDALIVYNHLIPTPGNWRRVRGEPKPQLSDRKVPAQLITDFYAYNTNMARERLKMGLEDDVLGNHWVGDLAIDCRIEIEGSQGEAILQLVEGGVVLECRIDVATGLAKFQIPGDKKAQREVATSVRGPGSYRLRFANVDDQLLLWVDGKIVPLDGAYGPLGNIVPNEDDLAPARLGTNGLAARFSELRVLRDVYYISMGGGYGDVRRSPEFFADPSRWKELGDEPGDVFFLAADRFMVCGDNSPRSYDSRMWRARDDEGGVEYYVKRELLVGKAVYIYWPHALDHLPYFDVWFPFFPNFARMGFVR